MTANHKHITSTIKAFSTFLGSLNISEQLSEKATDQFVIFLKQKKTYTNWPMSEVQSFIKSGNVPSSEADLISKFISKYPPHQVDIFLHEFILSLKKDNRSKSTVKNYRSDIGQFVSDSNQQDITKLFTRDNVKEFVENQYTKELKTTSIKRKLVSISQFAAWNEKHDLVEDVSFWISDVESFLSGKSGKKLKKYANNQKTASKEAELVHLASLLKLDWTDNLDAIIANNPDINNPLSGSNIIKTKNRRRPKLSSGQLEDFLIGLDIDGHSKSTIKNYKSDISQFVTFVGDTSLVNLFTRHNINGFVTLQKKKGLKQTSIKRKLVSLSQFATWAEKRGDLKDTSSWIHELAHGTQAKVIEVPTQQVVSIKATTPSTLETKKPNHYGKLLKTKHESTKRWTMPVPKFVENKEQEPVYHSKLKQNLKELSNRINTRTKKRFLPYFNLAMIALFIIGIGFFGYQQFVTQAPDTLAYPTTPTRPNRELSFQGRLTDTAQNPVTTSTNMEFRLYDAITTGTLLWDSGSCSVTPDQDGIFNTGLGDDCGSEISEDVFTENANVWLEVEIASETLTPRQGIKTVAYALNSETVQGYPISATGAATTNTILVMDSAGQVLLGEVSPTIKSTTGTFSIEAQALTLETSSGSNGDIILNPDGLGEVLSTGYFSAPGATFSATYAGGTSLVLKGGPSGTGNIQEWQQSDGTVLTNITSNGLIHIGGDPGTIHSVDLNTSNLSVKGDLGGIALIRTKTGASFVDPFIILTNSNTANSGGQIRGDGTAGGLKFTNYLATVEWMNIDSNGNVGIGSTTPGYALDLVGEFNLTDAIRVAGDAGTTGYLLTSSAGGLNTWTDPDTIGGIWTNTSNVYHPTNSFADIADLTIGGTSTASADIHLLANGSAVFNQQGNDADFRVEGSGAANALFVQGSDGFVGIGTSSPSTDLHIYDSSAGIKIESTGVNRTSLSFTNGGGTYSVGKDTDDNFLINNGTYTGQSPDFLIDTSGNIGIGTATPAYTLDLVGEFNLTDAIRLNTDAGTSGYFLTSSAGGLNTWTDPDTIGGIWTNTLNVYHPTNAFAEVADLVLGGTSTASADIHLLADGSAVFNQQGNDADFRIEGSGAANALFVQGSDGNVGIGTSSPKSELDVNGTLSITSSGVPSREIALFYTSGAGQILTDSTDDLILGVNSTGVLRIDGDGSDYSVGIGTAAPYGIFNVEGAATGKALTILNETGDQNVFEASVSGSSVFTIANDGNVGVGTNNLDSKLHLYDSGETKLHMESTGSNTILELASGYKDWLLTVDSGQGDLTFTEEGAADHVTFRRGGNVGIGSTTPLYKLDLVGEFNLTDAIRVAGDAGTSGYLLTSSAGGANTWTDPDTLGSAFSLWTNTDNVLHPKGELADIVDLVIGGNSTASAKFQVFGDSGRVEIDLGSDAVGLTIQGDVSQTANLTEWQDSSGTAGMTIDPDALARFQYGTGGATTTDGIMIRRYQANVAGRSTMLLSGTSSGWAGKGIEFSNHTQEININVNSRWTGNVSMAKLWIGDDKANQVSDFLMFGTYDDGYADIWTQKYASSPYPELRISGPRIALKVKANTGWADGGSLYGYGSEALVVEGDGINPLVQIIGQADVIQHTIKANATQTANLTEWQNSSDTTLTVIDENGWIGIGTDNPLFDLDIIGDASVSGTLSQGPMLQVDAGTCNASSEGKQYYDAQQNEYYYCNGSAWTAFNSTGTDDQTLAEVLAQGNTTSANNIILSTTDEIRFYDDDTDQRIYASADGTLAIDSTNLAINTGSWDISTAGAGTGFTSFTASGTIQGGTLTDGTASITSGALSGATGIASSGNIDLSALSAGGMVKASVTTGRLSIATAGTDYENPLTFTNGLTRATDTISWGGALTGNTTITQDSAEILTFTNAGTANTIFNLSSTGDFDIQDNGTSAFFVRDDGNVGIGTDTPETQLEVIGTHISGIGIAKFKGNAGNGFITLDSTTSGESGFLVSNSGSLIGQFGARASDNTVYIKNRIYGTNDIITLSSTGNVGISSITPAYELDLVGEFNLTDAIRVAGDAGTSGYLLTSSAGGANTWTDPDSLGSAFSLWTNTDNVLHPKGELADIVDLTIGGNSTASAKFQVFGDSGRVEIDLGSDAVGLTIQGDGSQSVNLTEWQNSAGTALTVVDSIGHIGVGTSAPASFNLIETVGLSGSTADFIASYNSNLSGRSGFRFGNSSDGQRQVTFQYFDTSWGSRPNSIDFTANSGITGGLLFRTAGESNIAFSAFDSSGSNYDKRLTLFSDGQLVLGQSTADARFQIVGRADEIQSIIQANSTQTANLTEWQNSGGTPLTVIDENGWIGIGTDTPLFDLDIIGDASVSGTLSQGPMLQVDAGTCNASSEGKQYYDAEQNEYYYCNGSAWTAFNSTGTDDQTLAEVLAQGNTTSANNIILSTTDEIRFYDDDTDQRIYASADGTLAIDSTNIDLSALSAGGMVKASVTTGRLSIATAGTDYENPLTFTNGLTRATDTISWGGALTGNTTITQDSAEVLTFTNAGTANTIFNLSSTGDFDIQDNGTSAFFVQDDGNVGIGTTIPLAKFVIVDAAGTLDPTIIFESGENSVADGEVVIVLDAKNATGTNNARTEIHGIRDAVGNTKQSALTFHTRDNAGTISEAMRIDSSGNIGIGSDTPAYALDLVGEFNLTDAIRVAGDAGTSGYLLTSSAGGANTWTDPNTIGGIWTNTDNVYHPTNSFADVADLVLGGTSTASANIHLQSNGTALFKNSSNSTTAFQIQQSDTTPVFNVDTTNGRVGIGTDSPLAPLHVSKAEGEAVRYQSTDVGTPSNFFTFYDAGGRTAFMGMGSGSSDHFSFQNDTETGDINVITIGSGTINFKPTNSTIGTFTTTGLGIGTTSPLAKLHITGTTDEIQQIIQANATQTANLTEWQNSSDTTLTVIDENGWIGIGTDNPLFDLDIIGDASVSGTLSQGPMLQVDAGTCNASSEGKQYYDAQQNEYYYCNASAWTAFNSTGTDDQTLAEVLAQGNTTSANNIILSTTDEIRFYDDDIDQRIYASADGTLAIDSTNLAINTGSWDISTAGAGTGFTSFTASGTIQGGTLTDGTASITSGALSGATGIASSGNIDLSALSAGGMVKASVTTGRLSIATAGTDYENPLTFTNGLTRATDTISWGGALTGNTTITQDSAEVLTFTNAGTANTIFNLSSTGDFDIQDNGTSAFFVQDDGNVGIGLATPGYDLDVVGNINLSSAIYANTDAGSLGYFLTSSAGGANTWTDPDTIGGIWTNTDNVYHPTNSFADVADLVLGGTSTASANIHLQSNGQAYFGGNVGIGTTAPGAKLDISSGDFGGTVPNVELVVQDNGNSMISILSPNTSENRINFGDPEDIDVGRIEYSHVDNDLSFFTNGSQRLTIDSAGNVGIGTSTPQGLFNVNGSATGQALTIINETGDQNVFEASVSGSSVFTIANDGNVGVGTSAPDVELHIEDATGDTTLRVETTAGTTNQAKLWLRSGTSDFIISHDATSDTLQFLNEETETEVGRIDGNGYYYGQRFVDLSGSGAYYLDPTDGTTSMIVLGNVGIGTSTIPTAALTIWDNTSDETQKIRIGSASGTDYELFRNKTTGIFTFEGNQDGFIGYNFKDDVGSLMYIQEGGNVGIGDLDPSVALTVYTADAGEDVRIGRNDIQHLSIEVGDIHGYIDYEQDSDTDANHTLFIRNNALGTGENSIQLVTSSTTRMTVADDGNVGIGTTTPTEITHIYDTTAATTTLLVENTGAQYTYTTHKNSAGEWDTGVSTGGSYNITIAGSGGAEFNIDSTDTGDYGTAVATIGDAVQLNSDGNSYFNGGNLGIGTTSPTSQLDIAADVFPSGTLVSIAYDTAETLTGDLIGLDLDLNTNLTGQSSNDVTGVNIQTPSLTAGGPTTTNYYGNKISAGALDTGGSVDVTNINWYGNYIQIPNIDTGESSDTTTGYGLYIAGGTVTDGSGTENQYGLIVDSSAGSVGIGITGPKYKLDVVDNIASTYAGSFFNDGNNSNRYGLQVQAGADSGSGTLIQFRDGDGTDVGEITFSGTTTTYGTSSDIRMKQNIRDTGMGLSELMNIGVKDYEFKSEYGDDATYIGYLAQDLYEILPHAVYKPDNPNEMWSVDYGKVTPLIVRSIQEQQTQIALLGTELDIDSIGAIITTDSVTGEYIVQSTNNTLVTNIRAFANIVAANITAGLTTTQELIVEQTATITDLSVDTLTINGQSLADYINSVVGGQVASTGSSLISPVDNNTAINIATESASVVFRDPSQNTVAEITDEGDLTLLGDLVTESVTATGSSVLGELLATNATVSGTLTATSTSLGSLLAVDATVSGTLVADQVDAASARITALEAGMAQLEDVRATTAEIVTATISGTLYADNIYDFENKIADTLQQPGLLDLLLGTEESTALANLDDLYDTVNKSEYNATSSADLDLTLEELSMVSEDITITGNALYIEKYFKVNGGGYISDSLAVGNSLFIGNGMQIADGLIEYNTADPDNQVLAIQPSGNGSIELLAGIVTIDDSGMVTVDGDLDVTGKIKANTLLTNLVKPTEFGNPLQVQVAGIDTQSNEVKKSRFEIINEVGVPVATFSAEGNAEFAGKVDIAGGIGIASQDLGSDDNNELNASKTSGKATIKSGANEVRINSSIIEDDTLIYVTAVGSTGNQVIYVKDQTAEDTDTPEQEGKFVVGFDNNTTADVSFNWWIVN